MHACFIRRSMQNVHFACRRKCAQYILSFIAHIFLLVEKIYYRGMKYVHDVSNCSLPVSFNVDKCYVLYWAFTYSFASWVYAPLKMLLFVYFLCLFFVFFDSIVGWWCKQYIYFCSFLHFHSNLCSRFDIGIIFSILVLYTYSGYIVWLFACCERFIIYRDCVKKRLLSYHVYMLIYY